MAVSWTGMIGAPGRLTRIRAHVADRALTLSSGRAAAAVAQVDNGGVGVMIRTARATFSGEASAAAARGLAERRHRVAGAADIMRAVIVAVAGRLALVAHLRVAEVAARAVTVARAGGWAGMIGAARRLTLPRAVVAIRALTLSSGRAAAADAQVGNGVVGVMMRLARATFSGKASAAAAGRLAHARAGVADGVGEGGALGTAVSTRCLALAGVRVADFRARTLGVGIAGDAA